MNECPLLSHDEFAWLVPVDVDLTKIFIVEGLDIMDGLGGGVLRIAHFKSFYSY